MSLSKTWYNSFNLAFANTTTATLMANSALWAFGAMLTGNQSGTNGPEGARPGSVNWTLVGSSNGTTSGIDSTDRLHFTGSFTSTDWTRAAAGSAHTWFVLESPSGLLDGPWYICIDYIGPTNDQTCSIIVANNVFSGGSTTARPTATNEAAGTSFQFISTTAGASKAHLSIDANGGFRFYCSRNGTGYFSTAIGCEPLVEYHSGDAARSILWYSFVDSGAGALTDNSNITLRGKTQDNSAAVVGSTLQWMLGLSLRPSGSDFNVLTSTNSIDGTVDAIPVGYIVDTTASHHGVRGRLPDFWAIGAQVVPGSTFPGSGNPERMVTGNWMTVGSVAPSL
jgi:hypothetical protein